MCACRFPLSNAPARVAGLGPVRCRDQANSLHVGATSACLAPPPSHFILRPVISIIELLDSAALTRIRELVATTPFVDGKLTAGARARRVKNNEMMQGDAPGTAEARKLIMAGLNANKLFNSVAFPRRAQPPMINRY